MEAFTVMTAVAAPMLRDNIDTDIIIPSREMKTVSKTGLSAGLFAGWRYTAIGGREPNIEFVLNQSAYAGTRILLGGSNFGCGSSREHAVWALQQGGFDAVIAPSFSDIFRNNCTKNGLLPIVLSEPIVNRIWAVIENDATAEITIDLHRFTVEIPSAGITETFEMDTETQQRFINGLDDISITLADADAISKFEASRPAWLAAR